MKRNVMLQVNYNRCGCHSSVVLSASTILRPWVRISSKLSMLFSICIIVIVVRKRT